MAQKSAIKRNKFRTAPVEERTHEGKVFRSKLEMRSYARLRKLLPPELIHHEAKFELQPPFGMDEITLLRRAITHRPDFVLGPWNPEKPGDLDKCVVLDAKGMDLNEGRVARKLFEFKYGRVIHLFKKVTELDMWAKKTLEIQMVNPKIIEAVDEASPITIKGYVSSDGAVTDLTIKVIGYDGYLLLMDESLKILQHTPPQNLFPDLDEEEQTDLGQAWTEVAGALKQRLDVAHQAADGAINPERPAGDGTQVVENLLDLGEGAFRIMRVRVIEQTVIKEGKVSQSRNKVTAWKKKIEATLPLSEFRFQLKLEPGKYDELTV